MSENIETKIELGLPLRSGDQKPLLKKLLAIQKTVDGIIKDGKNQSDKYDFASDENVLDRFRPLMDEQNLLCEPYITRAQATEGTTRSGTTRFFTELWGYFNWVDIDTGAERAIPFYAQGVDLAGEKGVGKAATYAEKYFLLKYFHVPTRKDDPDNDRRATNGEKRQKGTQAAKETEDFQRKAITQILEALYGKDEDKKAQAISFLTKNEDKGFLGFVNVADLTTALVPVVYAKLKKEYAKRKGKEFEYQQEGE